MWIRKWKDSAIRFSKSKNYKIAKFRRFFAGFFKFQAFFFRKWEKELEQGAVSWLSWTYNACILMANWWSIREREAELSRLLFSVMLFPCGFYRSCINYARAVNDRCWTSANEGEEEHLERSLFGSLAHFFKLVAGETSIGASSGYNDDEKSPVDLCAARTGFEIEDREASLSLLPVHETKQKQLK